MQLIHGVRDQRSVVHDGCIHRFALDIHDDQAGAFNVHIFCGQGENISQYFT